MELGNVSDHCDVTWFESVKAVDCRLEGGDRFGEIVLAIVPKDVRCGVCVVMKIARSFVTTTRMKTRSRVRMCRRRQHHIENVDGTNGSD